MASSEEAAGLGMLTKPERKRKRRSCNISEIVRNRRDNLARTRERSCELRSGKVRSCCDRGRRDRGEGVGRDLCSGRPIGQKPRRKMANEKTEHMIFLTCVPECRNIWLSQSECRPACRRKIRTELDGDLGVGNDLHEHWTTSFPRIHHVSVTPDSVLSAASHWERGHTLNTAGAGE